MSTPGSFIPLTLGQTAEGEARAVFRAQVVKPAAEAPFQSLSDLLPPPSCAAAPAAPRIELERNGRVITRIRITCACGQVMELDCRYETAR